jgi:predicted transcriptional regulator YdeE
VANRNMKISVPAAFSNEGLPEVVEQTAIKNGWGVFEHHGGISSIGWTRLRSVWREEVEASTEADRLEEAEGGIDFEISNDPESNIYSSTRFDIGRVVLAGMPEVVLVATYERAAE